jgi:hypothetical protein
VDLDLPRVLVGLGFLVLAGAMDWRRRVVKDPVWIAMGAAALALVELDLLLANAATPLHLMSAATAVLYFGVFFGKPMWDETGFKVRPLRFLLYFAAMVLVVLVWRWSADADTLGWFYRLFTMPAMIVIAHGLYEFGILRGGADAKAVMALALLSPGIYPTLDPLPLLRPPAIAEPILAVMFPFAFIVLVNSAILFLAAPVVLLAGNAARGDAKMPRALFGSRVPIDAIPKYAWLMDRIEDGKPKFVLMPRRKEDREEQVRLLQEHGFDRVWVTPQLPFVTAMLIGFLLGVVAGNPLLALFGGGGG